MKRSASVRQGKLQHKDTQKVVRKCEEPRSHYFANPKSYTRAFAFILPVLITAHLLVASQQFQ